MKQSMRFLPLAAVLFLGCSYVKPMPKALKKSFAAGDTIYILPAQASYSVKGFILSRSDSARAAQIRNAADAILAEEVQRAFPETPVKRIESESALPSSGSDYAVLKCRVKGFRRTVPREVASELLNVALMIPTFALNLGYPIQTTSSVYLEVKKPGKPKTVYLKHRDMLAAYERENLHFQIRKILDPAWKG